MHEVEVGAIGHPVPKLGIAGLSETAPPDHRQAQRRADLDHSPGEQAEAFVPSVLRRLFEEELVAEADAQDRFASLRQLDDPAAEAALLEPRKRGREGADTGKHDACGSLEVLLVRGEPWLGAHLEQGTLDRADVADAVVDDRDQPSSPFDDGTPAEPEGAIAPRSARPSALKVDSAM